MSDCYIGRTPCGCVECAVVIDAGVKDSEKWKRQVAKDVADWIRRGYSIERVSVEYVRENLMRCPHKPPKRGVAKQEEMAL